ncbi:MAG: amidohydrolase [Bacteroidota bacterium]
MKNFVFLIALMAGLAACTSSPESGNAEADNTDAPSLIVHNGKLATMASDGDFQQALAVKDGLIQAVGDNEDILKLKGANTEVIDLNGRTLIPGLNDSHTHVVRAGLNYNMELRWDGVTSLKRAMEMLKEQAARTPEGQWIRVVGGWTEHQFEEKRLPTLEEINEAVPDKPVFLLYLYSLGFINKKGIEVLGYDKDTYYPGGEIELDKDGNVTGFLAAKPSALLLYSTLVKLPKLNPQQQENSTLHYIRDLNRLGVTSAVDAGGGGQFYPDNYEVAKALARQGKLNLRIGYYLFATKKGTELDDFQKWTSEETIGKNDAMMKPNGYHMCGAGENIVWSAADFENFMEPRPVLAKMMEDELTRAITMFAQNKWPFRIHATYDESIIRFLDVFEKVDAEYPFLQEVRWIIDHAETVSDETLQRIKNLGGGIAVQGRMLFQGDYFLDRYGPEMTERTPPIRKMLEMDIPVGLGTDGTRVSSYNPILALYWAVSGKSWGGTELYPEANRLSRYEAIRVATQGSAWFTGEEKVKGSLVPGQYADFAVLNDDFFTMDEEAIKRLESVMTVVNGQPVYATGEFKKYDQPMPEIVPEWSPVKFYGGYQNQ